MCAGDFHGSQKIARRVLELINEQKVDVLLVPGDFHSQKFALDFFRRLRIRTFAVPGNWDYGLLFKNKFVTCAEWALEQYGDYHFFMVGPVIPLNFYELALISTKNIDSSKLIMISHDPPYGILDKIWSGTHIGLPELREFVIKKKPLIHTFGHVHEDMGHMRFQDTLAINCSIPDHNAVYIVDLPTLKLKRISTV